MKPCIFQHARFSEGAKELAHAIGARRRWPLHPKGALRKRAVVLNWGSSVGAHWFTPHPVLNPPSRVEVAGDKLACFHVLAAAGVSTVPFTTDVKVARKWAPKSPVVARGLLRGSGGRGILLTERGAPVAELYEGNAVRLWTQYIKKESEYRVHVFANRVIDVQQKRGRDGEDHNHQIRNLDGGWVYCREGVDQHNEALNSLAVAATKACQLDFAAVDIIFNRKRNLFYVLELNTAPGLTGTTVLKYAEAIKAHLKTLTA